jgi:ssDNA-binding Zn-finger/Zn-ribbon topoisomerase 1
VGGWGGKEEEKGKEEEQAGDCGDHGGAGIVVVRRVEGQFMACVGCG